MQRKLYQHTADPGGRWLHEWSTATYTRVCVYTFWPAGGSISIRSISLSGHSRALFLDFKIIVRLKLSQELQIKPLGSC